YAAGPPAFSPPQQPLASWHFSLLALQVLAPSPQITVLSKGSQDVVRPLHQHGSQVTVSFFTDVHLRLALTRVPARRAQPQKTADLATLREPMRVVQRQHVRQPDLRSYSLHLFE